MKTIVVKVFVLFGLFMFVGMIARAQNPEKHTVVNTYKAKPIEVNKSVNVANPNPVKHEKNVPMRNVHEQPRQVEKKVAPLENK